uniref:translation initiation factor IF-2 n=1 Tax=Deferrisoma camini TaxID=1035120 RepID=UPI00046CF39E|nr:translation initiation factor IF-2 [Deferrisoma camini]
MAKIRVFEAAKKHGVEVQALLGALTDLGVKVRSHLSPVDEADLEKALGTLGAGQTPEAEAATAPKPAKVVRRRRKKEETPPPEEPATEAEAAGVPAEKPISEPREEGEAAPAEAEAPPPAEPPEPAGEPTAPEPEPAPPAEEPSKEAEVPAEPEAGEPAAEEGKEPAEGEEKFKLKVVRFIHHLPEQPTPPPSYQMSKEEREASKAARKARKGKKGKRAKREVHARPQRKAAPQAPSTVAPKAQKRRIRIGEVITVSDLSQRMGVKATELIRQLMGLGVLATINQTIDVETAALVASEFGYEVESYQVGEEEMLAQSEDRPEDLEARPPVVTVMGHVDHGKTSLLDAIRETRVADREAGGITQHIGAYEVETSRGKLVFLDTPGHEAFTALRARGAKVTDITVLVVAADDGIMPQTIEAIDHSKAAGVPIIVAVNKMDKPDADPERVKRQLTEHGLVPEEWGGDVICVPVSAKKRDGIDDLLEMIALQAELLDLKANPNKPARGVVIEARVDRGRGPVASVLVQEGTLKVGDVVLAGHHYGRIRALINDQGKRVKQAGPSIPVEVLGLGGVPTAGEAFQVVESERVAKQIATRRAEKARQEEMAKTRRVSLEDLHAQLAQGEVQDLNLIIKADVQGSVEALTKALEERSTDEVRVRVIHGAVGGITENDVNLATASHAIIIGFNVRPESKASQLADQQGVDIRLYNVIYDAIDDLNKAVQGLLAPTIEEKVLGRAEVRQLFRVPKVGTVAGCYVTEGVAQRSARVRLLRDNVVVYEGTLASLKRFKDDVREVREGMECGLSIQNYNDIKEGDVVEFFVVEEKAADEA